MNLTTKINQITAIGLLLAFLFGSGIKPIIQVSFYLNQSAIVKEKCENKSKPEMKCNGKCYLAKKLKEADLENEKNGQAEPNKQFSFPELVFEVPQKNNSEIINFSTKFFPLQNDPTLLSGISSIFIPPPRIV